LFIIPPYDLYGLYYVINHIIFPGRFFACLYWLLAGLLPTLFIAVFAGFNSKISLFFNADLC